MGIVQVMKVMRPRLAGWRLRTWALLGALVVVFVVMETLRHVGLPREATSPMHFLGGLAILATFLLLLGGLLHRSDEIAASLEQRNRELLSLHRAALDVHGELSVEAVLQNVVGQAATLLDARYGAVSVVDEAGKLSHFFTTGTDPSLYSGLPHPCGHGLIGLVRDQGQRVRIADVASDPRHRGFPEPHPHLASLLAVPIECRCPFRGGLFVAEKRSAREFSADDEETLRRFAQGASIAIDNAHLHERLRTLAVTEERERIGREMHDGVAQLLAYVNTKAQAVRVLLERGHTDGATERLDELAAAARDAYLDARAAILDLRTTLGPERPLTAELDGYAQRWQTLAQIPADVCVDPAVRLAPQTEFQLLRIVQEALTNVRKHAEARSVRVAMRRNGDCVVTTVSDDGRGFDTLHPPRTGLPRFGLSIMRERAESVGGELHIESAPDSGTCVTILVPGADPEN
ncbi:MAG TPA: GAF domain-containing sensor histidine kinase [Longimicrobiales bacterium]